MLLKQDHGWQLHSVSNQGARKQKYFENVKASHRQENMRKTPTEAHKNQKNRSTAETRKLCFTHFLDRDSPDPSKSAPGTDGSKCQSNTID